MMNFWNKVKRWFAALGRLMFDFTKTTAARFIEEYQDDLLRIVSEAAMMPGSGEEKKAWAMAQVMALVPGASVYIINTAIEVAYATWKESELAKDTDGDGVPDYLDVMKYIGAPEGGSVTDDGRPDSDNDGIADEDELGGVA